MAVTSSNSGVIVLDSGDFTTDALDVSCLLFINEGVAVNNIQLQEGDASTLICRIELGGDSTVTVPFGGSPRGHHFPNGLAFTRASCRVVALLA